MANIVNLKCFATPNKGEFTIGNIYTAYDCWYDTEAGETEMRINDNKNFCQRFRDYCWMSFFEKI